MYLLNFYNYISLNIVYFIKVNNFFKFSSCLIFLFLLNKNKFFYLNFLYFYKIHWLKLCFFTKNFTNLALSIKFNNSFYKKFLFHSYKKNDYFLCNLFFYNTTINFFKNNKNFILKKNNFLIFFLLNLNFFFNFLNFYKNKIFFNLFFTLFLNPYVFIFFKKFTYTFFHKSFFLFDNRYFFLNLRNKNKINLIFLNNKLI
jgi:hypothetical protein